MTNHIATPTAIMAAIGNATKHGFLVREGDALEHLASVSYITFDKTGTLTYGTPKVIAVHSFSRAFERKEIVAGNTELLSEKNISLSKNTDRKVTPYLEKGCTAIFIAIDNVLSGFLALSDTLRENAPGTIEEIKSIGILPVLLTGDRKNAAEYVADSLHIDSLFSDCLPEDKLRHIEDFQKSGKKVCMIGDGINDAPALKKSYVGIAMGGIGSDIAVDAADIALINDELSEIPHLLRLAKRMMTTIKCNLAFSMTLNFIAIVLAITGILNPVVGALVHNAGSVVVIVNSAFLLNWRKRK